MPVDGVSRQHAATIVTELHGGSLDKFLATPAVKPGFFEVLLVRINDSWYRMFADEGVFFLSETRPFEALRELATVGGGVDLMEQLGWTNPTLLVQLSYREGVLVLATNSGSARLSDDRGLWRLAPYT